MIDHMPSTPPSAALPRQKPAPYTLIWLAAVFILPFVLGTGLFWSGWRPERPGNHGTLLQPAQPLPETGLRRPDGGALPTATLKGKWLLVVPVSGSCNAPCQTLLQNVERLHRALNKEQKRLHRVYLGTGEVSLPALAEVQQQFPEMLFASIDDGAAGTAWKPIVGTPETTLLIVDPFGNAMMRYTDTTDLRGVLKDLERLLKYSWIQ